MKMNEETAGQPRAGDLAFFGRMAAHVTHEMRNVLAIIGQNAGLMEDILEAAGRKGPDRDKLMKVAASMTRNVNKGVEVMERFSRFAHAADEPVTSFDLTTLTENVAALARRPVTQAGCSLEVELPDEAIPLTANSFRMQQAIFLAIQLVAEVTENGSPVRTKLTRQESVAVISVVGDVAGGEELSDSISPISAILDEFKGDIQASLAGDKPALTIKVPVG